MIYIVQVDHIQWDTDGAEPPSDHWLVEVECDSEDDVEEAVADKLSDDHGFCHKGFHMSIVDVMVRQNVILSMKLSLKKNQGDPLEWSWHELLDLGPDEDVEVHPA